MLINIHAEKVSLSFSIKVHVGLLILEFSQVPRNIGSLYLDFILLLMVLIIKIKSCSNLAILVFGVSQLTLPALLR